jgi:hypothetical protein
LCTIGGSDEAYGKALSFGAMYAFGMLCLYTLHVALCPEEHAYAAATERTPQPLREYHLVQLDGFDLFNSLAAYCARKTAIRNLREIARDVRSKVIASVNQRFQNVPSTCHIKFEVSQQGDKPEPSQNSCARPPVWADRRLHRGSGPGAVLQSRQGRRNGARVRRVCAVACGFSSKKDNY